jgi:hypothetical protein
MRAITCGSVTGVEGLKHVTNSVTPKPLVMHTHVQ